MRVAANWSCPPSEPLPGAGDLGRRLITYATLVVALLTLCVMVSAMTTRSAVSAATDSTWSLSPTPNVANTFNGLEGVACPSSNFCMAVGQSYGNETLTESWNGVSWSIVPSPNPTNAQQVRFTSVSCVSSSYCAAVGQYMDSNTGFTDPLFEVWDGTSWALADNPTLESDQSEVWSVSCVASTYCVAAGEYIPPGAPNFDTLVESWNGISWSVVSSPNASSTQANDLLGISCLSTTNCTAVGVYGTASGGGLTLIESWNGTSWSITPSPNVGAVPDDLLFSVSCTATTFCMAVGTNDASGGGTTLAEAWDGTSWSVVPSANLTSNLDSLDAISCPSSTYCVAAGHEPASADNPPLIESWDGTSWAIDSTPATGGELYGASCSSVSSCFAVGETTAAQETIVLQQVSAGYAQTIDFTSAPPKQATVNGPTYTVAAAASSGLPVSFSIDPTSNGACSISGSVVSFHYGGNCAIDAKQSGNGMYAPAPTVQQTLVVDWDTQSITFTSTPPSHPVARGPSYAVTATGGLSGNPVTFSTATPPVCTVAASTVSFVGAGTCTVNANQAGGGAYLAAPTSMQSFSVSAAPDAITSATHATAVVGSLFTFPVTTTGLPVPTLKSRGALPRGLHFVRNENGGATLSGTVVSTKHQPPVRTYSLTFTATFGKGKAKVVVTQTFTLTVEA